MKKFNIHEWQRKTILKEQADPGFDDRLKAAGGFSDEEMDDITSRDVGSSFPGSEQNDLPDFDENDVKNIEDEAIDTEKHKKTTYMVDIILPIDVPHFLLGLGSRDEQGQKEIAEKIADFYRKKMEYPEAYTGTAEKRLR